MSLPIWCGNNYVDLLEQLRQYVEAQVQSELSWYVFSKRHKSKWSRSIRFLAILFTALGGAMPILVSMGLKNVRGIELSQLGYLFLGAAAAFVGFDRFFGFSTSWMRDVSAMIGIEKSREQFRLDWMSLSMKLSQVSNANSAEYAAAVEAMLQRARDFLIEVKTVTEKETQAWVAEFQTNLSQMEKDLKAQMEAGRPGAVDVEVTDGSAMTGGVELYLDGLKVEDMTGTSGSIGNVAPGIHKITVKGKTKDRDFTTSKIVTVTAATVSSIKMTLGSTETPGGGAPAEPAAPPQEQPPADEAGGEKPGGGESGVGEAQEPSREELTAPQSSENSAQPASEKAEDAGAVPDEKPSK